ncbi:MAG: anhydro-N-acetylmuramic acid kinase, partial [Nitrospirae bacterium]|nr:anhydro-N-acetylmuramic acid kinase [Nitrospirota bacterium]
MNKTKDLYKIIGLMSGTSHDGLDAALVNINPLKNNRLKIKLIHHIHIPYDAALRNRIHNAFNGTTEQICRLNFELGEVFSQGVLSIIKESNVSYKEIDCVSSHGQTIYHIPPSETTTGCTLQIGESSIIAQRTGIPVISDFRTADMAVGGQGAPLVPMADYILFGKKDKTSAVLNIGGMANVTIVSDTIDKIIAFDTGPGNSLIDEVIRLYSNGEILFDNNGEIAQKGKPEKQLLDTLLSNQYFKKSPPKSTGRELFGLDYAKEILLNNIPIEDIICTLTHLTAITIVDAISPYNPDEIIVTGGGVYNSYLIELMTNGFREKGIKSINKITKYGIPPEAK